MQVLYGRHHVRVFRFGLRLVRDEQVAEDLISEVFLDVWRQAGKFEGRSAVSTWLLAITRFKALSALRRRKDVELDDEAANAIEDTSDDPEVAVQKKDTSEALRKCLTALSPEHREIVDLVYYHEKSVEEVAEIVGIPENTVKTRLFYARKKLAELLQGSRRGARLAMMAMSKKMLEQEPGEIEMLLPWHAAGTLNARDARRVEEALARDPELARQYAAIRRRIRRDHPSQRKPRRAVGARHAEAVRGDRRRAGAQAVGVAQYLGADCRVFRQPVAADAGLVGKPRRAGAVVAGRRDRRGAGEEPDRPRSRPRR